MANPAKLYAALQENSTQIIAFRDFERLLVAFGFEHRRTRGSHKTYRHPQIPETLTIQPAGKDAEPYQVRRFMDMVAEHNMEIDS